MNPASEDPRRAEALAFLLGRIDYERSIAVPYNAREFRLDRMRELLARLGNPQERLKIVHVAGTKGKGSTSAMIAAVLTAAGYRTGLYTSPHLDRLEERFMIDGRPCSAEQLVTLFDHVRPAVGEMDSELAACNPPDAGPTYFEITTAMALLHFVDRTDAAVLEVGLGGRLDSTNVCRPLVSAITSISFDHTKQLGNTLAEIAAEKAGIIKPGVLVVSGVISDEAKAVIAKIARQNDSRLVQLGEDFDFQYLPPSALDCGERSRHASFDFEIRTNHGVQRLSGIELGLLGRHQAANAAVALAVLNELAALAWNIPEHAIRQGLRDVRSPARVEVVGRRPTVVVDAAHNVASVQSLLETLGESFSAKRRLLIFGTTQEKDVRGMLELLLPRFDAVILTRYLNNPRAVGIDELDVLARQLGSGSHSVAIDAAAAWRLARELASPDDLICVTGSFFLAAEVRRLLTMQ